MTDTPTTDPTPAALPTFDDVQAAARRLAGAAHRTPVLTSRTLDARAGARVFLKAENLQRMGAFKFRGAYNALSRLREEGRANGVVAYSSGNHAQAVALSARLLGMTAVIVMPHDAPAAKVAATRGYGAEVVSYDRFSEDREAIGRALADERGLALVPPYDHFDVIAGQGTATLELLEDAGPLDTLFVCLGGGGLLSGALLAAKALSPATRVYGVEPEAGDDGRRSLREGRIVHIPTPATIADGAQTQHLGELTFPIIRAHAAGVLAVPDEALVREMRFLAERLKVIVEPTGALGLAGALSGEVELGERVGVLISGGNVDLARFAALIADA